MIISADKNTYSPPEMNVIKDVNSSIPLVLVTRLNNYVFNEELLSLGDYVLVNLAEFGWDFNWEFSPIFGTDDERLFDVFQGDEWRKFNDFVKSNPPKLTFQREILRKDLNDKIKPLSYPCYQPEYKLNLKEEFDARPLDVCHYFGRSSEERMIFQGNAYIHASEKGFEICDNIYYLQGFLNEGKKKIWVSTHIPHFARIDISQILQINGLSKLALSMPGCGKHCFREGEVPVNSVMVLQDNDIPFPFEWVHNFNCIRYKGDNPIPAIDEALKRDDLYDIYLRGLENIDNYRYPKYSNYIEQEITKAL